MKIPKMISQGPRVTGAVRAGAVEEYQVGQGLQIAEAIDKHVTERQTKEDRSQAHDFNTAHEEHMFNMRLEHKEKYLTEDIPDSRTYIDSVGISSDNFANSWLEERGITGSQAEAIRGIATRSRVGHSGTFLSFHDKVRPIQESVRFKSRTESRDSLALLGSDPLDLIKTMGDDLDNAAEAIGLNSLEKDDLYDKQVYSILENHTLARVRSGDYDGLLEDIDVIFNLSADETESLRKLAKTEKAKIDAEDYVARKTELVNSVQGNLALVAEGKDPMPIDDELWSVYSTKSERKVYQDEYGRELETAELSHGLTQALYGGANASAIMNSLDAVGRDVSGLSAAEVNFQNQQVTELKRVLKEQSALIAKDQQAASMKNPVVQAMIEDGASPEDIQRKSLEIQTGWRTGKLSIVPTAGAEQLNAAINSALALYDQGHPEKVRQSLALFVEQYGADSPNGGKVTLYEGTEYERTVSLTQIALQDMLDNGGDTRFLELVHLYTNSAPTAFEDYTNYQAKKADGRSEKGLLSRMSVGDHNNNALRAMGSALNKAESSLDILSRFSNMPHTKIRMMAEDIYKERWSEGVVASTLAREVYEDIYFASAFTAGDKVVIPNEYAHLALSGNREADRGVREQMEADHSIVKDDIVQHIIESATAQRELLQTRVMQDLDFTDLEAVDKQIDAEIADWSNQIWETTPKYLRSQFKGKAEHIEPMLDSYNKVIDKFKNENPWLFKFAKEEGFLESTGSKAIREHQEGALMSRREALSAYEETVEQYEAALPGGEGIETSSVRMLGHKIDHLARIIRDDDFKFTEEDINKIAEVRVALREADSLGKRLSWYQSEITGTSDNMGMSKLPGGRGPVDYGKSQIDSGSAEELYGMEGRTDTLGEWANRSPSYGARLERAAQLDAWRRKADRLASAMDELDDAQGTAGSLLDGLPLGHGQTTSAASLNALVDQLSDPEKYEFRNAPGGEGMVLFLLGSSRPEAFRYANGEVAVFDFKRVREVIEGKK